MFYSQPNDTEKVKEYNRRGIKIFSEIEKCMNLGGPTYDDCIAPLKIDLLSLDEEGHRERIIPFETSYYKYFQDMNQQYKTNFRNATKLKENKERQVDAETKETEIKFSNQVSDLLKKLNLDQNDFLNERIQRTFKENTELRDSLESKLQDLYGKRSARFMDSTSTMDASTYANLMWTIIATTSLYIIITYR